MKIYFFISNLISKNYKLKDFENNIELKVKKDEYCNLF